MLLFSEQHWEYHVVSSKTVTSHHESNLEPLHLSLVLVSMTVTTVKVLLVNSNTNQMWKGHYSAVLLHLHPLHSPQAQP